MSIVIKYQKLVQYPLKDHEIQAEKIADWVYLIYSPITNLYKIGITKNLRDRYKQIMCNVGAKCVLVDAIQMEEGTDECASIVEQAIHKIFKHNRKMGEWFSLSIYDLWRLKQLQYHLHGWDFYRNCDSIKEYIDTWDEESFYRVGGNINDYFKSL